MTTTSRRPPRTPPKPSRAKTAAKKPAAKKAPAKKPAAKKPEAPAKTSAAKTSVKAPAARAKAAGAAVKTRSRPGAEPAAGRAPKAGPHAAPRRSGQSPPRTPFILLIVGLLGGALVSLLLLNTVLAKDAFTLTRLQQSNERLEERQQELELQNAQELSPGKIAERAESLGMKPNDVPVFFDTDTGRPSGREIRPVPHADAAAAGAASVIGVPGTVVPGDGAAR